MALDIRGGAGTGLTRINPSKAGLIMGACCRYRRVSIKFFLRSKPPSLFSLSLSCAFPAFRLFSFSISTKRSREERFNPSRWEGSEATEEMDETKMLESFFPRVGREEEKEKGKEAAASKLPAPSFRIHNPVSSIGFFFHRRITISNLFLAASIFRGSTHDRIIHDA